MAGIMYTKKSLSTSGYNIDPLLAQRYAHERYLLTDRNQCVDPNQLNFDAYMRQADPFSLTRTQQGTCSALDPLFNIQNWLIRENNVDRPYIEADINGGYMHDTMGVGRQLQQTYTGGTKNNQGGWYRINMPRNSQATCDQNVPIHRTTDSSRGNQALAVANTYRYSG